MNGRQTGRDNLHSASVLNIKNGKVGVLFNSSTCKTCALNKICLESSADIKLPKRLANITLHPKPIHRGEHLFRQGDKFHSLYVVRSGSIKLYLTTRDGSEQITNFYYPGEIISLDSIETGLHNTSALALDTASVCVLPYEQIKALCRHQPDYYDQLVAVMTREICDEHYMLLLLGQKPAEEKFASFLLDIAERGNSRKTLQSEFQLTMTRHDIANYLCLADETISRLIGKFTEDKIIKVKGRQVQILDVEELRNLANIWQPEFRQAAKN